MWYIPKRLLYLPLNQRYRVYPLNRTESPSSVWEGNLLLPHLDRFGSHEPEGYGVIRMNLRRDDVLTTPKGLLGERDHADQHEYGQE